MQQYEIGITLLSQEAHTRESRSNTLALTIKAYELAPLSVSLPSLSPAFRPLALSAGSPRNMYREFISIEFTADFKAEHDLPLCRFSQ